MINFVVDGKASEDKVKAQLVFIDAYDVWANTQAFSPEEGEAFVNMVEARQALVDDKLKPLGTTTWYVKMIELKPCPFCGGEPVIERLGTRKVSCIIVCEDCGCLLETNETNENCGCQWNIRGSPASRGIDDG